MREHSWADKWARTVEFTMSADYSTHPLALQSRTYRYRGNLERRIAGKLIVAFRVENIFFSNESKTLLNSVLLLWLSVQRHDFETCYNLDYLRSVIKDSLLVTQPFRIMALQKSIKKNPLISSRTLG